MRKGGTIWGHPADLMYPIPNEFGQRWLILEIFLLFLRLLRKFAVTNQTFITFPNRANTGSHSQWCAGRAWQWAA